MSKIINLFAGPGAGKSTIASGIFYNLKSKNYKVDFVQEFAKRLIFENRVDILQSDQLFILANQNRDLLIRTNQQTFDYIIMESSILLSNIYLNELSIYDNYLFKQFTLKLFTQYDNINFFLVRNNKEKFDQVGRIHTFYESVEIDLNILRYLKNNNINFKKVDVNDKTVENICSEVM